LGEGEGGSDDGDADNAYESHTEFVVRSESSL
jgi:hypothetical protein